MTRSAARWLVAKVRFLVDCYVRDDPVWNEIDARVDAETAPRSSG